MKGSLEWAGLECAEKCKVADFITTLEEHRHGQYVHVFIYSGRLAPLLIILKYQGRTLVSLYLEMA